MMLASLAQRSLSANSSSEPHLVVPAMHLDIAAQNAKQLNNEQNKEAHRFSHLISIMPAGVLLIDHKGCVTLANEQAISLLGEPLVGQLWREVIARAFSPKADDGHEVSMKNGKRVKIDISPLKEEKGQLIVVTDLTETRELQSKIGHMQRLSSLGNMVASLAHQVRTPLSSALLYAENLKSMPLNNDMASRFTSKLTDRLKELESQVNDMLLFAKSSDKQIVTKLSALEIQQQACAQIDAQLKQSNIQLNIQLQNQHKDLQILGNLTAVAGAISNLIANAMQALTIGNNPDERKTPCIELSCQPSMLDGNRYLNFTVSDNGNGIDESKLSQIFEPFYTTKSQGTGLGLAVVNTVAKSHKGKVTCGNVDSGGAYFSILLPLLEPAVSSPDLAQSQNTQHAGVHS